MSRKKIWGVTIMMKITDAKWICLNFRSKSVLGLVLFRTITKVPARASLFVKKSFRLKIFLMVAGIDECSNCDVGYDM